jgi:hypothetical protein
MAIMFINFFYIFTNAFTLVEKYNNNRIKQANGSGNFREKGNWEIIQLMQKNKKLLDDLIKRRYVFFQGCEIYGGCAGLYDFGPVGCAIKTNLEQIWREHFVLEEEML